RYRDRFWKAETQSLANRAPLVDSEQRLRLLQDLVRPGLVVSLSAFAGIIRINSQILLLKVAFQSPLPPPGVGRRSFPGMLPLIESKVDASGQAEPGLHSISTTK